MFIDNYIKHLEKKKTKIKKTGYDISESDINSKLFDHQKFSVKRSLNHGDHLIAAGTGLGKSLMQIETSRLLHEATKDRSIIIAPLAIVKQTKLEAEKFNYDLCKYADITNYQQLKNIDLSKYKHVLLDESSILKNPDGKTSKLLIDSFKGYANNFSYSATPSPNTLQSFGTQAQFLKIIKYNQFLAKFFTHDGGDTQNWILREWAKKDFWQYLSQWSIVFSHPSDLGFDVDGYDLPELNLVEHVIKAPVKDGLLFNKGKVNATDFNRELRDTRELRLNKAVDLLKEKIQESHFISIKHNEDGKILIDKLRSIGVEAYDVSGSGVMYPNGKMIKGEEEKANKLIEFAQGKYQVLITKDEIASFGLNFQKYCWNTIITAKDFSFESSYQWLKRVHRFGQKNKVNAHIITTDSMANTLDIYHRKEKLFNDTQKEMSKAIIENIKINDFLKTDLYGEKEMILPNFI